MTRPMRLVPLCFLLMLLILGGQSVFAAPPTQSGTVRVIETQDFVFEPKVVTVQAGTTVTWDNTGEAPHTATAADQAWDTGNLNAGEKGSLTFDVPGTYAYYCLYHGTAAGGGMAGTLIVEAAPEPTPTAAPAPTQPPIPTATAESGDTGDEEGDDQDESATAAGGGAPETMPQSGSAASLPWLLIALGLAGLAGGLTLNGQWRRQR